MPRALADALLDRCAVLWNLYGPTETTIWSILDCVDRRVRPVVSIGRPIANTRVYVVDRHLQPQPVGMPGELYIGGAGVARGYLGRPDLTSERFVPDPFALPGGRLYRTGDLARWLPDGTLEFLGRLDQQVKVRGFRVEAGEVEAALARHPAVHEAAVVAADGPGGARLVAYLVPVGPPPGADALRRALREWLPDYMVPAAFVPLERLPLTPNGKLDRRALPAAEAAMNAALDRPGRGALEAPRDSLEEQIARVWRELLGVAAVDIHERFFDLGGHSLLAVRLLVRLESLTGRRLAVATFVQDPTIAGVAAALRAHMQGRERASAVPPGGGVLVPLHEAAEGSRRPLFFATAGYGDLIKLQALARHLDTAQPMYALQPAGDEGKAAPLERTEELAATYVHAIRTMQPVGPYSLAGYSIGGLAVYETARLLRAAGEEVAFLGLLDTLFPVAAAALAAAYNFMQKVTPLLGRAAVAPEMFEDSALAVQIAAARHYSPGAYDGHLTLFVAREVSARFSFSTTKWRKVAAGGADVILAAGRHDTMLLEPQVATLTANIQALLTTHERA